VQIGYISIVGNISLLLGTVLYNRLFKNLEFRYILAFSNIIVFIGNLVGLAVVLGLHKSIGISAFELFLFQNLFEDAMLMAFIDLPLMVLFAKIIPKRIEGSVFAFLTGTINFSNNNISPMIGSAIN
jgi:Na+/melibiose symporter-like transporter